MGDIVFPREEHTNKLFNTKELAVVGNPSVHCQHMFLSLVDNEDCFSLQLSEYS